MVNLREIAAQLEYIRPALGLVWQAARKWTVAWLVMLMLQGILPAVSIYLTRPLVDSLVGVVGLEVFTWDAVRPTLTLAVLVAAVYLATLLLQSLNTWVNVAQSEYVSDYLLRMIHQKATSLDLAFYESPAYHDILQRARQDAGSRPLALLQNMGSLIQNGITLVALAGLLIPYGVWLPFVLLISTIPGLFVLTHYNRRNHRWWEETTSRRRLLQYYDQIMITDIPAAEVRLFDLGTHFREAYQALRRTLREQRLGLIRAQTFAQLGSNLFAILVSGGVMLWMVLRVMTGTASLGDLTLFYQTFNRGQRGLGSFLGSVGQIYSNTLFLSNLFEFFEQSPLVEDPNDPQPAPGVLQQGIHFNNITFYYPDSDRAALTQFELFIPAGQTVALVGANGAGKTTLLKLLCRFYDPQEGNIQLDGVDLRSLATPDLRRMLTVMFQKPVPYQATAINNIAYGDFEAPLDMEKIGAAARSAGAHEVIMAQSQGYDTLLGKAYAGGTELSGGEWQRIGLARAFFRSAPIMILDEPTSALDSWSEADWYDRFSQLSAGRTSMIITHRLTIARRADMIHVMDQGKIVESGTHHDLLDRGGLYARSWAAQIQGATEPEQSRFISVSGDAAVGSVAVSDNLKAH
jgi:ATP-binding cassette subfamily B protein